LIEILRFNGVDMSTSQELIQNENTELQQIESNQAFQLSPVQIMQQAKAAGLEISDMKEMLSLQKEYEANEARKAFHLALAEFKKNPPKIVKDMLNKQYGSNYVSIGNMVNTVNEEAGKHGLNARWDFPKPENNLITVTCILAHKFGHEESVTLYGEVDKSGAKNVLQGHKSTRTYLKLETFEAVMGVASVDGNVNDDGNSNSKPIELITEDQANTLHSKITNNGLNMKLFMGWFTKALKVDSIDQLPAGHYEKVLKKIDESIANKNEAK